MPPSSRQPASSSDAAGPSLADRLHSSAIHLLRRLRRVDEASGLSASRLSALSVIVFAGPIRVGELAAAEQVSAPTISRLVGELEKEGLVRRVPDREDGRAQRVEATAAGRALLKEGRRRRVDALAEQLDDLTPEERAALARGVEVLERLALPDEHPRQGS